MAEGIKYDDGKPMWSLLPMAATEEVVRVLTAALTNYERGNWKRVDDFDARYFSAALRHLTRWHSGERFDADFAEQGHQVRTLACAAASILFLLWGELEEEGMS